MSLVRSIGSRPYQEDQFVLTSLCDDRFLLASVMDGHDGGNCSHFLKDRLSIVMSETLMEAQFCVTREILNKALVRLHCEWEKSTSHTVSGGSTLTGILIDATQSNTIWTFNLGDSRTMIYNAIDNGKQYATIDHDLSPQRQQEVRSMTPNAVIRYDEQGVLRLCGSRLSLNLSGGYGNTKDTKMRRTLLRRPEIDRVHLPLSSNWTTIIASDGLWDDLTTIQIKKVAAVSASNNDPLAVRLQKEVERIGQKQDNLCIICLHHAF